MWMKKQIIGFLVVGVFALGTFGAGDVLAETVNFDKTEIGKLPPNWIGTKTGKGEPQWAVVADDSAPSKPNVLKQSGVATYPVCIKDDTNIKDGYVEVKFKPVSGKVDQAGGVIWRCKDANNYYIARANALEDNVVLYKTVNGKRTSLDIVGRKGGYGVKEKVASGEWHTLRVEFAGNKFTVIFNGKTIFDVEDNTFINAGKVGVWTKADSVTLFDDFSYGANKQTVTFDQYSVGSLPFGWSATITGAGKSLWTVENSPDAPSQPNVLKQSAEVARGSYPLCIKEDPNLKDGYVEVKLMAVSGKVDQAGGVIWRCKDANNYYIARANALEDNVVLYKTVNGKRTSLDIVGRQGGYGVEEKVASGQWHTLRVEFTGNTFTVIFNGKKLFDVQDDTFPEAGKVGLWTKADSVTLFDDFSYGANK